MRYCKSRSRCLSSAISSSPYGICGKSIILTSVHSEVSMCQTMRSVVWWGAFYVFIVFIVMRHTCCSTSDSGFCHQYVTILHLLTALLCFICSLVCSASGLYFDAYSDSFFYLHWHHFLSSILQSQWLILKCNFKNLIGLIEALIMLHHANCSTFFWFVWAPFQNLMNPLQNR